MAITTQGHVLTNLARFTPADPSLVAFNPGAATQGVGQAFALADQLDKIRAYRAAQKELSDTRLKRVAAQNASADLTVAKSGSEIRQMPSVERANIASNELRGDEANARKSILDVLTESDREAAITKLHRDQAERSILPEVYDAKSETAKTEAAMAAGRRSIIPKVIGQEEAQADAATGEAKISIATQPFREEVARQAAAFAVSTAPVEQRIKMAQLLDAYNNATSDLERKRLKDELSIELERAKIRQTNAEADYLNRGKDQKPADKSLEEARLLESIGKLEKLSVVSGGEDVEFREWLKDNVDSKTGQLLLPKKGRIWDSAGAENNPVAIQYYNQWKQLQNALSRLRAGEVDVTQDLQNAAGSATQQQFKGYVRGPDGRLRKQ